MARMIDLSCGNCGSHDLVFDQNLGLDKFFKCKSCESKWLFTQDGFLINPDYIECVNCHQINKPDARICQECGAQIRKECPNCGKLVDLDAKYCPYCEIQIQSFLEERKQRQAEEKQSEGLRRIQKLESEIQSLQNSIDS